MKKILYRICFFTTALLFSLCLPCCSQETDLIEISAISRTNDGFKVDFSQANASGALIVALYSKNNALVAVNSCDVTASDTEKNVTFSSADVANADTIRAFVWSSLESLTPISASSPEKKVKASFNYKRNNDGTQAFLYKFGTLDGRVEISIAEDSLYNMNDLNFEITEKSGYHAKSGALFSIKDSDDYSKTVKFLTNYSGTAEIKITDKNTNELQDVMQVELLAEYNNVSTDEDLATAKTNTCFVPTRANGGVFHGSLSVNEKCRVYGNDCLITAENATGSSVHEPHFKVNKNASVENIRFCGPYVDKIYNKTEINEGYEGYKVLPSVSLAEGSKLKNVYVKHGAYGVEVAGKNAVLEDVTIECAPVAVKMKDNVSLTLEGDNIFDNAVKSGDCANHKFGLGIACLETNEECDVSVQGNLHSHSFVTASEYNSNTLNFSLPENPQNNKLTIGDTEYINPLAAAPSTSDINMLISNESNLYGLISKSEGTSSKLLSYDKNKVEEKEADLAYLLKKPDAYTTETGFSQFMYIEPQITPGEYTDTQKKVDFSSVKFKKYGTVLSYTMDIYKVYTEENNTTVYEYMTDGVDNEKKTFTVSDADFNASAEFYVIFNVTDSFDNNKVYTHTTTTITHWN